MPPHGAGILSRKLRIRAALEAELTFLNGVNSALVTTMLDHIAVKKESAKQEIYLDVR